MGMIPYNAGDIPAYKLFIDFFVCKNDINDLNFFFDPCIANCVLIISNGYVSIVANIPDDPPAKNILILLLLLLLFNNLSI